MTTTQPAAPHIAPARPGRNHRTATPPIAFLGTGRMGGAMAANLARAGFGVRAWDRTASHAAALTKDGAAVAGSPAEAVTGAGILITMLADGPATEQVWNGPDGLLAAGPGLIWVQMATVGAEWTQRFANTAARYGVSFVDAPVSGSQGPAQAGQLTILASGPRWLRDVLDPVFAALGRATAWLGPAGNGTRAKLVLNNWLADLTETTAETLSFARQLGLDPDVIVDLLESTPLGSPYATQKARTMLAGDFTPAFALKHALKDAELAAQAAQASGATLALTDALLPRWRRAAADGHADDDLAAIYTTP
ncbi:MAG TPA: NAD(P)-dependent oxidoreductase [Streptosporangiaceae bacterium]|jgi:3-hydroxyisobutyrate dehydrogenase|nr:NAD(P)-dependent oxidoreductase [Streptosporangiaceae bacterium]